MKIMLHEMPKGSLYHVDHVHQAHGHALQHEVLQKQLI